MNLIIDLLSGVLIKLIPWATAKLMEWINSKQELSKSDALIDKRLSSLKQAYVKAFDGNKVTAEQKEDLKSAIREFIRSGSSSGV